MPRPSPTPPHRCPRSYSPLTYPRLLVDGAPAACHCIGSRNAWSNNTVRCDCRTTLPASGAAARPTAVVSVEGWAHLYSLPARFCMPLPPPDAGPRRRVFVVYEKHGHAGYVLDPAAPTPRDVGFVESVERHARHAACALGAHRYELVVHEHLLRAWARVRASEPPARGCVLTDARASCLRLAPQSRCWRSAPTSPPPSAPATSRRC